MDDRLEQLVTQYELKYPQTTSPLEYLFCFGEKGITNILQKAKGREIKFTQFEGDLDRVDYEYIG